MSRNARIASVAALIAVAVIAFIALRPGDEDQSGPATATTTSQQQTTATKTRPTAPQATVIRVAGGKPVGGVKRLTAGQGGRIRFTVTADAAEHVHLHGYDIEKPVGPGAPASFDVPAGINGVFEIELEDSGVQIAELTVEP